MRFGIVANALGGSLESAPAAAAKAGYDGVEWSIAQGFGLDRFWDPAVRRDMARRATEAVVALSSVILSIVGKIDFPDDAAGRRRCRELILAAIDACASLGVRTMMVPCLKKARATPPDQIARAGTAGRVPILATSAI
ncbi:MAG: hypothetical protein FJ029_03990 [Actinobacteria bacterium]|nr:hypothetical protein [Actinomycetota bacterium]